MALDPGNKYEIGKFLVVGMQQFIRQNAADAIRAYEQAGFNAETQRMVKRAVDLPHRLRTRIQLWMSEYDAKNAPGDAQALMVECINLFNEGKTTQTTFSQVNSRLAAMETYATNLVAQAPNPYGDGTLTWDQLVADLKQHAWEPTIVSRLPPLPLGYTDVWGE